MACTASKTDYRPVHQKVTNEEEHNLAKYFQYGGGTRYFPQIASVKYMENLLEKPNGGCVGSR